VARRLIVSTTIAAAALTWTSGVASADPQPDKTTYAIGKCVTVEQPASAQPVKFDYNCDNSGVLDAMTWSAWGYDGAKGTGTDTSLQCQPNCAQGKRLTNPVVVHAWNPSQERNSDCPPGVAFYRDMTLAYPKDAPPWIKPGTTWDEGTEYVEVDGMPAVHFSNMKPWCRAF
jgi:hypothetical protein